MTGWESTLTERCIYQVGDDWCQDVVESFDQPVGTGSRLHCLFGVKGSGRKISVLLDTGCQSNIVGRYLVPEVELKFSNNTNMIAANGSPISVLGNARIELLIGKMAISVDCAISDEIDEFIVGVKFLTENNCGILRAEVLLFAGTT